MKARALDLELRLGVPSNALWADSEGRHQEAGPVPFGVVLGLRWGDVVRPLGGQWFGPNFPRRVLSYTLPWWAPFLALAFFALVSWQLTAWVWLVAPLVGPFVGWFFSVAVGVRGFYIGAKDFGVDREEYKQWLPPGEVFDGSRALAPSASPRRSRF